MTIIDEAQVGDYTVNELTLDEEEGGRYRLSLVADIPFRIEFIAERIEVRFDSPSERHT
jgi:hypothetical protein